MRKFLGISDSLGPLSLVIGQLCLLLSSSVLLKLIEKWNRLLSIILELVSSKLYTYYIFKNLQLGSSGGPAKIFHGVGIGPLSKILAVNGYFFLTFLGDVKYSNTNNDYNDKDDVYVSNKW